MDGNEREDTRYKEAKERVEEIAGFYTHAGVWAAASFFIFLINYMTNRHDWWFWYPVLIWGAALVMHAAAVFVFEGPLAERWKERKIRQLMDGDHRMQGT